MWTGRGTRHRLLYHIFLPPPPIPPFLPIFVLRPLLILPLPPPPNSSIFMVMDFCKNSLHSFLTTLATSLNHPATSCKCQPDERLVGLVTVTGSSKPKPNILESATVKSSSLSSSPSSSSLGKCSSGSGNNYIGFLDDVGGGVIDGLMSCTESLGFESSDERRVDDDLDPMSCDGPGRSSSVKWRRVGERRRESKVQKFPPPISSLNHNGLPNFFLRPVRRDGRLELTEVRIDRPEIFRASPEDGRLRLHLVRQEEEDSEDENEIIQAEELEDREEEEKEVDEEEEEVEEEEEEERGNNGEWSFPVTGEGFMRCNEAAAAANHHHHNIHVWSQQCVTTR